MASVLPSEFALIRDVFARHPGTDRSDIRVGIGDDAAVLACPSGMELVATADTLIAGRHFFPHDPPETIGHKALAVNLSDLAAMGAEPAWFLLSLSLPLKEAPASLVTLDWLRRFAAGMAALAHAHGVALVGGDTVRGEGPLQISIHALGHVPAGKAVRRHGACRGDTVWVTGSVGDAALALALPKLGVSLPDRAQAAFLARRLQQPTPRVALGAGLRAAGLAHAMVDISDGLLADLGHLLSASQASACLSLNCLPLSDAARSLLAGQPHQVWQAALGGGDDYELCFTASSLAREAILSLAQESAVAVTAIGEILTQESSFPGDPLESGTERIAVRDGAGRPYPVKHWGFDHLAS